MLENNFQPIILSNLRKYSKIKCAIYFSLLFIVATLTFSVTGAVCFVISYILGFVLFYSILKFKFSIIQFLLKPIVTFRRSKEATINSQYAVKVCNICENENCLRHLGNNCQEPWINLHVHKQLDQSIENFYNIIIRKFIIPWYCKLTKEEILLVEIRFLLRYASSSLFNRVLKVNIGQLITNKLIPCALRHYTLCNEAKKLMEMKGIDSLEKAALLGPLKYNLHPALTSRKQELQYLKFITEAIMPFLLPKKHMNSKLFKILIQDIFSGWVLLSLTDILADPSIINTVQTPGMFNSRAPRKSIS
ncbi:sorting nexin-14-like [Arctopsyche grandis]|uniref:sorting nexin-14-like n=1 Tax=Arctopsyche grandis TaxID=121162 RepID=UPI00406D7DA5